MNKASGEALFFGIVAAIAVHFVFRTLDRIYFPVWAEVRKIEEAQAKDLPLRRPALKRVWYGLLWIIPVVMVVNLTIRFIVTRFLDEPREIEAFYADYSIVVYAIDAAVWLALSVTGVLPGTAKSRRSFVDHSGES